MSVVNNNSRAEKVNMNPFNEQPQQLVQEQQKPQELEIEQKIKNCVSQPVEDKKLTLEDYEKKEIAIRSVAIAKDSWAFLKVLSRLEHTSQQDYLDLIIQEKKKSLNLGEDILKKIEEVRKNI